MKKVLPLFALLSAMALVGCGTTPEASSPAKESASTSKSQSSAHLTSTTIFASSSSAPAAHADAWTKVADTKNADDKTLSNYTCTCGKAKVEIAIADASSGASDIGAEGKLGKGKTFTWKFVAPKAGNAKLQFFVKYGSEATSDVTGTIWGNYNGGPGEYVVKNGDANATVLVNTKTYEETGVTVDGAYIDFATMAVTAGENVVSLTTPSDQYYRNCFINNVALIIE